MKVLVALDGSLESEIALEQALLRSWPYGSELRLLHVCHPEHNLLGGLFSVFGLSQEELPSAKSAADSLQVVATAIGLKYEGLNVVPQIRHGDPVGEIVSSAKEFGVDILFVGTRDASRLETLFLGSVSQSLLEKLECPVVVSRPCSQPAGASHPQRILICLDDSPGSAAALEWLLRQQWLSSADVGLVAVLEPNPHAGVTESVHAAASEMMKWELEYSYLDQYLRQWAALVQAQAGVAAIHCGVSQGQPAETILKVAENWSADLIVLGSQGRSGLAKVVLGSVSQKVARLASCSVEVVKGFPSFYHEKIKSKLAGNQRLADMLDTPTDYTPERSSDLANIHTMPPTLFK